MTATKKTGIGYGAIPMLILLPGVLLMALYQILTRNFTSRAKQEVNILAAASPRLALVELRCQADDVIELLRELAARR